eukprot:6187167-Pleurochrysis_carterae.AAC.2
MLGERIWHPRALAPKNVTCYGNVWLYVMRRYATSDFGLKHKLKSLGADRLDSLRMARTALLHLPRVSPESPINLH